MDVAYWDTSAVVKRYIDEIGSAWVRGATDLAAGNLCWIATIATVEMLAAFYLRVRTGTLSLIEAQVAEQLFRQELPTHFQVIGIAPSIFQEAMDLVKRHSLRAYDAVHLAAALHLNRHAIALGLPAIAFICADQRLSQAAKAEGFQIDDPNLHP